MATKKTAKLIGHDWTFSQIWQENFNMLQDRPLQKRNHIYASELGGSFYDRYLKMNAVPYSNPFNPRSKGKMYAGKFFESVVKMVLIGTGIYQKAQLRSEVELKNCLRVSGRMDFIAGGNIDWDAAKVNAETMKQMFAFCFDDLSPFVNHMTDNIVTHFQNLFGKSPLMPKIMEVKSVSGFVYQLIERGGKPRRGHPLQTLHYLLGSKEIEKGLITYISREDVSMQEFDITAEKALLKEYKDDVATMTHYYNEGATNFKKHIPPTDPEVQFEEASFKFVKNNKVEYSPYLTMGYGYKSIEEFDDKWGKRITKWNTAFRRSALEGYVPPGLTPTGKLKKAIILTDDNKKVADEVRALFPDWDKYVKQAKKEAIFEKEETEE